MVTSTKERRRGNPRGDVERLMEHRGISAGEAEDLLRSHPAEELLPQQGTGLLLGTAAEVHSPNPKFLLGPGQSYFPTSLRVDEPFTPQWVITNEGDSGEIALAMIYQGDAYLLWKGIIEAGQTGTLTTTEPIVITGLVGEIERTQTLELSFIVGYLADAQTIAVTDTWELAVYVEVPAGIPWWPWLIGGGVAVVAAGIVLTGRK